MNISLIIIFSTFFDFFRHQLQIFNFFVSFWQILYSDQVLRLFFFQTEEAHTKDILELQDKEEALQQELEGVRQGLSKKSIILQDSR